MNKYSVAAIVGGLFLMAAPVSAAPPVPGNLEVTPAVDQVHYRHYRHRHYRHYRYYGYRHHHRRHYGYYGYRHSPGFSFYIGPGHRYWW